MAMRAIDRLSSLSALIFTILMTMSTTAHAQECTLIIDAQTGSTVEEKGACDDRYTAASTFKVALALMGYDSGTLIDAHLPLWRWQEGMRAPERDKKSADPTVWQADSVLWYSRELTHQLGAERLSFYVDRFNYGNKNLSGEPGKNNGLSHSWVTSLTISPREQTDFIRRLLKYELPVSPNATNQTMKIVPTFYTKSSWRVQGKTGSGWTRNARGKIERNRPEGWFIGWAERKGRVIVFARLGIGAVEGRQGLIEQKKMLAVLENL